MFFFYVAILDLNNFYIDFVSRGQSGVIYYITIVYSIIIITVIYWWIRSHFNNRGEQRGIAFEVV